jgi:hypothetical protein
MKNIALLVTLATSLLPFGTGCSSSNFTVASADTNTSTTTESGTDATSFDAADVASDSPTLTDSSTKTDSAIDAGTDVPALHDAADTAPGKDSAVDAPTLDAPADMPTTEVFVDAGTDSVIDVPKPDGVSVDVPVTLPDFTWDVPKSDAIAVDVPLGDSPMLDAGSFLCGGSTCTATDYCYLAIVGPTETGKCLPLPSQCLTDQTCACVQAADVGTLYDCQVVNGHVQATNGGA